MAAAQRDLYEVLGVPRDADDKTIKEAFRKLALELHPDRNKSPGAEERFKEVAAAYAVLSDPAKRKQYDARGFAGFSDEELFRGVDLGDLFGGGFGGDLFERFFGRRRAGPARGASISVDLEVPLARVLTGGEETVSYTRPVACASCGGTGARDGKLRRCEACQGTGQKTSDRRRGSVLVRNITTCEACRGKGVTADAPCAQCRGAGIEERAESLIVTLPVGFEEGMVLRVPGRGMPAETGGGAAGDLLVVVHSAPDPRLERRGVDLVCTESVSVVEAALGTRRKLATLDGDVEVTVPHGTQPGTVLRLPGKGLPALGGGRRGHLYLRVEVRVPARLSRRARELYEKLLALDAGHAEA